MMSMIHTTMMMITTIYPSTNLMIQNYGNDVPTPVMHYTNVFHLSSYVASEQEAKSSGGGIDTALALPTLVDASNTAQRNGIGAYGCMTSALVR